MKLNEQEAHKNCVRCGRAFLPGKADKNMWAVQWRSGYAVGLVCPNCQTPEENVAMQIDEIEALKAERVEWDSLTIEEKFDILDRAVHQQVVQVAKRYAELAKLSGKSQREFRAEAEANADAWAREAVDSWPGSRKFGKKEFASWYELAGEHMRGVFGLDSTTD